MEEFLHVLRKSPLFYGINEDELYTLLKCSAAEQTRFEAGEYIYRMGESLNSIMVLLTGRAQVIREDFWGQREEIGWILEGQVFGASYSCARTAVLPVSVTAREGCQVIFMDYQRMITFCSLACGFHTRLVQNLLRLVSEENVRMENQLDHMCRKTTREKLMSYLSQQAVAQGSREFEIPHSRQELARYLGVDRSAMSSELGKMRAQGLLDFRKNHFILYGNAPLGEDV